MVGGQWAVQRQAVFGTLLQVRTHHQSVNPLYESTNRFGGVQEWGFKSRRDDIYYKLEQFWAWDTGGSEICYILSSRWRKILKSLSGSRMKKKKNQQITQLQSLSTMPKRNWDEESELDGRVGQKLTAGYGIGKAYFEPPPVIGHFNTRDALSASDKRWQAKTVWLCDSKFV